MFYCDILMRMCKILYLLFLNYVVWGGDGGKEVVVDIIKKNEREWERWGERGILLFKLFVFDYFLVLK